MALGLCLLWGYCGVLSFGQVAYFGIAGYVYGIIAGNLVGTGFGPIAGELGGLAACAVVAAVFGYFVFYARVQAWIVPILTLVLTLLLETFLGQTAGYQWRVGNVQLGGYNGMTGIPSFQIGSLVFYGYAFYYFVLVAVVLCYFACRMVVNSHFGKVMLAIREDPLRAELLGYDIRARQLGVFVLASVLAGISGLFYVQWGNYITPSQVGLVSAALPVIWVAVGGRTSLPGRRHLHLRPQLGQLLAVVGRQPVRSRHHRGPAGDRHAFLPSGHRGHAGRGRVPGQSREAPRCDPPGVKTGLP